MLPQERRNCVSLVWAIGQSGLSSHHWAYRHRIDRDRNRTDRGNGHPKIDVTPHVGEGINLELPDQAALLDDLPVSLDDATVGCESV
jgi:hypothetical protein